MNRTDGYSLLELMATVAIVGVLAALALPRVAGHSDEGKRQACFVNKAEIEIQAQLWRRSNAGWPATNLADIAIDTDYFPEGLPTCPADESTYSIDSAGRVVGHTH